MIALTPHMRLLAAIEPADVRRGIDGLAQVCREALGDDPFLGTVFLFRNRRATSVKLLVYDGQGFWHCQKRLSRGRFAFWPTASGGPARTLEPHQAQLLLSAGDPAAGEVPEPWRRLRATR